MQATSQIVLPSRYYLDHFDEMIDFLHERYDHAFDECHHEFLGDFSSLDLDARCLYVRIANRKGRIFRWDELRYDEIKEQEAAAEELREKGFIREPDSKDKKDLLILQTRPTLVDWIRNTPSSSPHPKLGSAKKRELVQWTTTHLSFSDCFPPDTLANYVVQDRIDEIEYLFYLYFGKLRDGLTAFALRDLGVVKPATFRKEFEARFDSREAALVSYHYEKIVRTLRSLDEGTAEQLLTGVRTWPQPVDHKTESLRAYAIGKLGRYLERHGQLEEALQVYRLTDQFPATERAVRLHYQLDQKEKAREMLSSMIADPSCDEELIFAEDFHERKFGTRRVGRLTEVLRSAQIMHLDESGRGTPEAAVVHDFARQGVFAFHAENSIWQMLFGLLFWDVLFGKESAPLHNSFELRPSGLSSGEFAERNKPAIEAKLTLLNHREKTIEFLHKTWKENEGTPNGLLGWYPEVFAATLELVNRSPDRALQGILTEMVDNHRANRSGFPDLMILEGDGIRFAEVKTSGDRLQRHQLAQLERLRRFGYPVEVIRAEWTVDPEQEYVVVDVETTGGNAKRNRVTEIGAVKVRGGVIIDEWTTLLNPERSIPKRIVELTGITDEMVKAAPLFPDVADEFREFLGDSVFVAHRAAFDFGFLRAEFQRIEQDLQCPTMCTVVAMRRYFPGLQSYGLAKLCQEFEVKLDNHHRALADAKATAELLLKINERRLEEAKKSTENRD